MKIFYCLLLFAFLQPFNYGQNNLKCPKGLEWGMTVNKVNKIVRVSESKVNRLFLFEENFIDYDADIILDFNSKGKLFCYFVNFTSKYTHGFEYYDQYSLIKDKFIAKYGAPIIDEIIWAEDKPQESIGYAIEQGLVTFMSQWNFDNGILWIFMSTKNYETRIAVSYESTKYKDKEKKEDY